MRPGLHRVPPSISWGRAVAEYSSLHSNLNANSLPADASVTGTATSAVVLKELAEKIRAGHAAVQEASSNALERALYVGDVLLEARKRKSTGWINWLRDECGLKCSTA